MRTDPIKACANEEQRFFWAFVHDLVSHPFMAITGWSKLSLRLHDWTSHKAWPRTSPVLLNVDVVVTSVGGINQLVYSFAHPKVSHKFVTAGVSQAEAQAKADEWFNQLSREFGGDFKL